jgi:hypothetical protein
MSIDLGRRASARIGAVKNRVAVQFSGSPGRQRAAARLVDICPEGALIVTTAKPGLGMALCFRLEEPAKTDWIWANPVRYGAPWEVGLRFYRPCPGVFLMAATVGIDLASLLEIDRGTASTQELAVPPWMAALDR